MTHRPSGGDDLSAFIKRHVDRVPPPPPGHIERVVSSLHSQRQRQTRQKGALSFGIASLVAASLLLHIEIPGAPALDRANSSEAAHIVAESFAVIADTASDSEDPAYETWIP